jgi:hypothetical protein
LLVIGAYTPFGTYDKCRSSGKEKEHDRASPPYELRRANELAAALRGCSGLERALEALHLVGFQK